MSLFSYQGSLFFRCSSATFISYHVRFSLSRTFLTFLKSFCSLELLSSISAAAPCDVDYHITPSAECQHLFLKFFIFFKLLIQLYYCIYNLLKINFLSIHHSSCCLWLFARNSKISVASFQHFRAPLYLLDKGPFQRLVVMDSKDDRKILISPQNLS